MLGATIDELQPAIDWLLTTGGVATRKIGPIIEAFPKVLLLKPAELSKVTDWLDDIGIASRNFSRIIEVNPKALGYDVQRDLDPTMWWLAELGVQHRCIPLLLEENPLLLRGHADRKMDVALSRLLKARWPHYMDESRE